MIKKLKEEDNAQLSEFLAEERSMNLFIIGDIEAFGYDTDFQELWGDFSESGKLRAVLLRYFEMFIPYAKGPFDVEGFGNIIKKCCSSPILSGKKEIAEQFEHMSGLNLGEKNETYFAELLSLSEIGTSDHSIKKATIEDIDRIIGLRSSIGEFKMGPNARDLLLKTFESKTGRTYYMEEEGRMIASASTTAESSNAAMIVAVCSLKEYRRQGFATAVMQRLICDMLAENKVLCLFYSNPKAGRIYKRLGFKDIGMWTMFR
ncbi:GNAT family N-acetyltransferase [Mesobacillus zeae]|uniref:GNAT family N-acetyltransferase n=1 Tax=Mesobacillus zeae TaxID=1917180 RepID=A0A398BDS9_9BACI|nr:GNAT family N-acetyltransferase [Mesobacillus zeae]RID88345.1 GNAT family N-acetyltransferase [Mesobacillus zeae]